MFAYRYQRLRLKLTQTSADANAYANASANANANDAVDVKDVQPLQIIFDRATDYPPCLVVQGNFHASLFWKKCNFTENTVFFVEFQQKHMLPEKCENYVVGRIGYREKSHSGTRQVSDRFTWAPLIMITIITIIVILSE